VSRGVELQRPFHEEIVYGRLRGSIGEQQSVSLDVPSTATTRPVRANHLFQSVTGEGAALRGCKEQQRQSSTRFDFDRRDGACDRDLVIGLDLALVLVLESRAIFQRSFIPARIERVAA